MIKIPKIVGVLNITPDSCSDGGLYMEVDAALSHAKEMMEAGVNVIDIGAVSTRPDGQIVSYQEEISRLENIMPELRHLVSGTGVIISLDSCHYQTIDKFMQYIDIINDVTGLENINMQDVALASGKEVIFMHSMGVPVNNKIKCLDSSQDVVGFLCNWRQVQLEKLMTKGFNQDQLIFDPGIGFGKDAVQSLEMVVRIKELVSAKVRILLGYSRKSFLSIFGENDYKKRDLETHIVTNYMLDKNIDYIRVHDVPGTYRAINLFKTLNQK